MILPEGASPGGPGGGGAITASGLRKRVLLLTHRTPYPPDRGDRIRSYHLARVLSQHFGVDIACVSDEKVQPEQVATLERFCDRLHIERISRTGSLLRAATLPLIGKPFTPSYFYRHRLARTIERWHHEQPFDAVLTFCSGMISYARRLMHLSPRPRHVLDLVDVDSIKWTTYARIGTPLRLIYAIEAKRLRRIESAQRDTVDAITVVSESEADAYRGHVGENPRLAVVHNGVDTSYFAPLPDADTQRLAFVGVMNYRPNVEAVAWFVEHVWPQVRQRLGQATFAIVGKDPNARVRALGQHAGVEVIGAVADVREHLARATAVVVPLLMAPGVQNKVLEAMSSARAVVCSPPAARGIEAEHEQHLLIAQDPIAWTEHITSVLTDAGLRQRLAQAARQRVVERYAWEQRLAPMVQLLAGVDPTDLVIEPRKLADAPAPS